MNDKKLGFIKEQIKGREEKLQQLKVRLKTIEQQQRALNVLQVRRDETRRKIVSGAFLLNKMDRDDDFRITIFDELDASLLRNDERRLFGLPPIENKVEIN
jgi:hypothetical protein